MIKKIISVTLMMLLATAALAHSKHQHDDKFSGLDTEAAKAIVKFHQAIRSGDEATVKAALHPDVLIFEGKGVERSRAEYASHHMKSDMKFMSGMTVTPVEQHVIVNGNMAFSMAKNHQKGSYKTKEYDFVSNESLSLTLVDGHWLITHIHWSN